MRALFGEKFNFCEIRDVMERDDMEKAHREGWLKRVLEEADDYDMPELIDPDEYEGSMPDLVHPDEGDAGIPNRVRLGDDGAMTILLGMGPLVNLVEHHRRIHGLVMAWDMRGIPTRLLWLQKESNHRQITHRRTP